MAAFEKAAIFAESDTFAKLISHGEENENIQ